MTRFAASHFLSALALLCAPVLCSAAEAQRPNILILLADDLGYSDIGVMGSEIATPNLDALAAQGRLLTSMYSTSMPISRAALLTGADPHQVGYGSMGPPTGRQVGKPGYERHLNNRALTVAELLRDAGYHTCMVGAWALGPAATEDPSVRGFEKSYVLVEAAADYFQPESRRLSKTESITYRENGREVEAPQRYVTDVYTDKLISFIAAHTPGEPFFAYASYTASHFPLHATDEDMARQRGKYDRGYDAVRLARIARQKRSGVVPESLTPASPVPQSEGFTMWENLSAQERKVEARRMEIYAAMIERLDANIGRLIAHLKRTGRYDSTLIIFTSGNGAADTWRSRRKPEDVDNSYDNMGRRHSWLSYSERWAEVSNAPFSRWKGSMTEGGLAVPAIVKLPGQARGKPPVAAPVTLQDVAPTILELVGIAQPGRSYKDREVVAIRGRSMLALLRDDAAAVHVADAVFAGEHGGEAYVRQGQWKAVRLVYASPGDPLREQELAALAVGDLATASQLRARFPRVWRLYDIHADRGETRDESTRNPHVLAKMKQLYEQYEREVGVVDP
jgi:arylsulfatase A-like enzyme